MDPRSLLLFTHLSRPCFKSESSSSAHASGTSPPPFGVETDTRDSRARARGHGPCPRETRPSAHPPESAARRGPRVIVLLRHTACLRVHRCLRAVRLGLHCSPALCSVRVRGRLCKVRGHHAYETGHVVR